MTTQKQCITHVCVECGEDYQPPNSQSRYCGNKCRQTRYQRTHGLVGVSKKNAINQAQVGALSELKVCADLLQRGYHVFRSVAPHADTDLIIYRTGGPLLKVEVRTAYERNGRLYYPLPKPGRFDILALCTEVRVVYEPDLISAPSGEEADR